MNGSNHNIDKTRDVYKISILVPVYNAEKYFEKCLRSLFEQSYSNIEYVFVDDCTPDNSIGILLKVLEDYPKRKKQSKIIHNRINQGAASAKNNAIRNATGDFVCFVDSDDWLEKNSIEILVKRQLETGADVVWGAMMLHTDKGSSILKEPLFNNKQEWMLCYIHGANGPAISNSRRIIRKSLLDMHDIKFADGLNYLEDRLLMCQIAFYADGYSTICDVVYHYNQENANSSMALYYAQEEFCLDVFLQEVGNLQLIEEFFVDKNIDYYYEAAKTRIEYIKEHMDWALQCGSKKGFSICVKMIETSNPNFWNIIRWNKGRVWRWLHGNYYYRKLLPIIKKQLSHAL